MTFCLLARTLPSQGGMSKVFEAMEKAKRAREYAPVGTPDGRARIRPHQMQPEPLGSPVDGANGGSHPDLPIGTNAPTNGRNGGSRLARPIEDRDFAFITVPQKRWELKTGRFGDLDNHLVSLLEPSSMESEQYRKLRFTVEQLKRARRMEVLAVSSAAPGDGKTLTALNLAGSLAQGSETPVLVVEADLRKPSIATYLRMRSASRGLVEAVSGGKLEEMVQVHPRYNLAVLPAGRPKSSPYEILKSARLGRFLQEARQQFHHIVVDSPPLLPFPDCRLIQEHVDGVLIVVGANRTPKQLVKEAVESLDADKIVGLVFNGERRGLSRYYKHQSYKGTSH